MSESFREDNLNYIADKMNSKYNNVKSRSIEELNMALKMAVIKYINSHNKNDQIKVAGVSVKGIVQTLKGLGATNIRVVFERKKVEKRIKNDTDQYLSRKYNYGYGKYRRDKISREDFEEYGQALKIAKRSYPNIIKIQENFESTEIYRQVQSA